MLKTLMIRSTLLAFAFSISMAAYAIADSPKQVNVPAGDLITALESLARQADVSVVYQAQQLAGLRTRGASGNLTPQQAVTELLQGTRLRLRTDATTGAMLIEPSDAAKSSRESGSGDKATRNETGSAGSGSQNVPFSDRLRLAQAGSGQSGSRSADPAQDDRVAEVIVTAEKRDERLQDVPVPVTRIAAETLVENNKFRLQDYYTSVPGLSLTPVDAQGQGAPTLTIRGITTGAYANPTVGIVVDDVPYGSSSLLGFGEVMPDIDPSELSSIEVLRGPQGTLYGASSIGGLLKLVTVDPSTGAFSGDVQSSVSSVNNSSDPGFSLRGAVNVPISATFAIRASASVRTDPGYIDNIQTGQDGVNKVNVAAGRLAALWKPSDDFSLKLSALYQETQSRGAPYVDVGPGFGEFQQSRMRDTGQYDKKFQVYSAIAKARLGTAELTSITGYSISSISDTLDLAAGGLSGLSMSTFGVSGAPDVEFGKTKKLSEELRVAQTLWTSFDWLVGLFYTHENNDPHHQQILAADPVTGVVVGSGLNNIYPNTFEEYAAFADFTYHFTEQFDVQVGGRESHNQQTLSSSISGAYVTPFFGVAPPILAPNESTSESSFTYLVTPRLKLSDSFMLYARIASGYQPGGPNTNANSFGVPEHVAPDKTQNYEIGAKGDLLDRRISYDASVYYIDWKDLQITEIAPSGVQSYFANAGRAKSQGVELSIMARPTAGLTLSAWGAWDTAELTDSFPANAASYGRDGDRLPFSARFSGSLTLNQDFPLTNDLTSFVGASVSYVGDRIGNFAGSALRQTLPAYTQTDLRAGVREDTWTVNLFASNLTNRLGVLNGGIGTSYPQSFTYIQPRTIGLSVSKKF